ncbi:hypothetical protein DH2020_007102 [Rehmannia glutinosa]|uniref:Uncharacterized protein n=1 Tax=Rehmannia glutinosa TaxID=99300 RepID=A0ABR0TX11_REHGL
MAGKEEVKHLEECSVSKFCFGYMGFLSSWCFDRDSVGIKRKSLAPLVFFGTTGTMLDIIMGVSACEREHRTPNAALGSAKCCSSQYGR